MMNKAAITVTAEDKQSVYGEAEAALTYVLEGETYGQNVTVTLSREAGHGCPAHTPSRRR